MNLYKIKQSVNNNWDTYDSAVVVAHNKEDAVTIHPDGSNPKADEVWFNETWVKNTSQIEVEYLGPAYFELPRGVVLASFNAG